MTSPQIEAAAASTRSEADVRAAKVIPLPTLISDMLGSLLDAKIEAQKVLDNATQVRGRLTSTDEAATIIAADLARREAFEDWYAADNAYNAAIEAHCKRLREARNASA